MKEICVLASGNKDKLKEIRSELRYFDLEIRAASELGPLLDVAETADSFAGNARLKALAYHELYPDYYILADDSGLCVDALDGAPGIYSARYGGTDDYQVKSELIWSELRARSIPERDWTAKFVCALAWLPPREEVPVIFQEEFAGVIIPERRGDHGFGYDPIFYLPGYDSTSAELEPELKNWLSHRGKALRALAKYIDEETYL